jgi:hypothetical protein
MTNSFRDLVEKISKLSENDKEKYTCPLCDENPCVCDQDKIEPKKNEEELDETVSPQRLAKSFADTEELPYAIRVFSKLKAGEADSLNNNDRLEAAKILKMLIPTISEDDLFTRINNDMVARTKAAQAAQNAPAPNVAPPVAQPPGTTAADQQNNTIKQ